jgi:hypothetical protein
MPSNPNVKSQPPQTEPTQENNNNNNNNKWQEASMHAADATDAIMSRLSREELQQV